MIRCLTLSGRKEVLINVEEKAEVQQPQACPPTHTRSHSNSTGLLSVWFIRRGLGGSYTKRPDWEQISAAVEVLKYIY